MVTKNTTFTSLKIEFCKVILGKNYPTTKITSANLGFKFKMGEFHFPTSEPTRDAQLKINCISTGTCLGHKYKLKSTFPSAKI
jgi:hypothetical protein